MKKYVKPIIEITTIVSNVILSTSSSLGRDFDSDDVSYARQCWTWEDDDTDGFDE